MNEVVVIENLFVELKKKKLIQNLSLILKQNTITCIVAPNGTGKTTFFKSLATIIPIKSGRLTIKSESYRSRSKFNQNLFFLESSEQLFSNLSAYENMQLIAKLWGNHCDLNAIIDFVGIRSYQDKKVKFLSLGMKQKVLVALSISSGADFLIFDEPLNGLDLDNIQHIAAIFLALKNEGKTLLLSSHNIFETSKICDTIYFLNDGALEETSLDYDLLKKQYNERFSVIGGSEC